MTNLEATLKALDMIANAPPGGGHGLITPVVRDYARMVLEDGREGIKSLAILNGLLQIGNSQWAQWADLLNDTHAIMAEQATADVAGR